ncbi:thymidylate synthase [Candidatus Gottesmanbacteria bacterium]|nr:thymidylate synthase [Candidatus Gottesmanbacteria bacterium]
MKKSNLSHPEYQYLTLCRDILENGTDKKVYNAETYIRSVFGRQIRFDLSKGFPLLTTKKVFLRGIIYELLWFVSGNSNIMYLVDNNVHIWDEWAYKPYAEKAKLGKVPALSQEAFIEKVKVDAKFAKKWGELNNVYGAQWRRWPTSDGRIIDQLGWAIEKLKSTPYRKHIVVSAWNPEFIYEMASSREKAMALPPCHTLFQFSVTDDRLSLQLYQRSADLFLGVPFNIASYSLLTMMVAQVTGLKPGEFIQTFGDVHIYSNHFDQVKEQITRIPKTFPKMVLNPKVKNIDEFVFEDFILQGYNPHPPIKGEITVVGGF